MTRRNSGLLELKHGALIVLAFILDVTAGEISYKMIKMNIKIVIKRIFWLR